MAANKVRFGLKNVHYSKITTSGSTTTYATPVAITGAVSVSLSAQGENTNFYADNGLYYFVYGNTGYSGTLEIARIPEGFLKDICGMTEGATSKVLTENSTTEPAAFALLFEIDGDADEEKYVFYNCTASRPEIASETTSESKEPKTQSLELTCAPDASGRTYARTTAETPSATKSAWFGSVFVEQ